MSTLGDAFTRAIKARQEQINNEPSSMTSGVGKKPESDSKSSDEKVASNTY